MKKNDIRKMLAPVVESIQSGLGDHLILLVLFGSRARGTAQQESDWDLLVIARELPKKLLKRNKNLLSILPLQWCYRVSIIAKTPEEFEAALPSLYLDIALDGIILCDQQGYIQGKLDYIQKRIKKMGLVRQNVEKDWIWLWKQPPGNNWELEWSQ